MRTDQRFQAHRPSPYQWVMALSFLGGLVASSAMTPAYAADDNTVETVIVTANKREQNLQNVAASVTAISSQTIQKFEIDKFSDYATLVPGLTTDGQLENRGLPNVGLRGVSSLNGNVVTGQNTVGFYLDDTPVPIMNPHLGDVERVEVLRGPQGTLYGSSSLAGTIKIVTKQPEYGSTNGWMRATLSGTQSGGFNNTVEGAVNVPLAHNAALRVSAYSDRQSGYIDFLQIAPTGNLATLSAGTGTLTGFRKNNANTDDSYGGRAALAVSPTDDLKVTASVMFHHEHHGMDNTYTPNFGLVSRSYIERPITDQFVFANLALNWDLHWANVVSTTSYFRSTDNSLFDATNSFSVYFDASGEGETLVPAPTYQNNREWTHETRLISSWGGPLQFVGGFFFTHRESDFGYFAGGQGNPQLFGLPLPNDTLFENISNRKRQETAVFGEATYAVTPWLSAIAGLRWYDFQYDNQDILNGSPLFVDNSHYLATATASAHGLTPRFRVEMRPDDNKMFYASASKGFRMGGPNIPLPHTPGCLAAIQAFFGPTATDLPASFDSDSLWSYEVGAKTSWLDRRLTVDAAVYHIDWSNTQAPVVLGGLCPFTGESTNVGAVKSDGFEVEASVIPFSGLNVRLGLSHVHERVAEALTFPGAAVALAPKGGELPDVPEWQVALMADYSFPLNERANGFVRGDYRYQSSRLALLGGNSRKDAYDILNLRAGVDLDTWEAAVFVDNVGNARPDFVGFPTTNTIATYNVSETLRPRTIGVTLSKRF